MSSEIWSVATENGQADMLGRHIGRAGRVTGRVTSRIGYTNKHGDRIVRKWGKDGVMIETKADKLDI